MTIGPRGPEGVLSRMQEIRQRMEAVIGRSEPPPPEMAGSLSGPIGTAPFNPFGGGSTVRTVNAPAHLKPLIKQAAEQHGVDPALFDALVATESAYDPQARSRAGAMGLSQLMPGTAQELGVKNPLDAAENLAGGAKYFARLLERFGDARIALAAYNAGPRAVEKAGNTIPPYRETQEYVERVMQAYQGRRQP